MPAPLPTTPLSNVEWLYFQQYVTAQIDRIVAMYNSPYTGHEENFPDATLNGSPLHIQRVRELLTLRNATGVPVDTALIEALQPFQRGMMEYQLRNDINGDGKIYGWDYVYVNDPSTDNDIEPQPMLRTVASIPEVYDKINKGLLEIIPGNMPDDGLYVPGPYLSIHGRVTLTIGSQTRGLEDAVLSLTGATTQTVVTDAQGYYQCPGVNVGSHTITPVLSGFTFTPATLAVTVGSQNVADNDFTAIEDE